jgi:hypothetical protein
MGAAHMETVAEGILKFSGLDYETARAEFLKWSEENEKDEFRSSSQGFNEFSGMYEIVVWL